MSYMDDFKLYLPKYLSEKSYNELLKELTDFPANIDQRFYTTSLDQNVLYQGDCIRNLPVVKLFKDDVVKVKYASCIMLSNTCDMDLNNNRAFESQIMYAPIYPLSRYVSMLDDKIEDKSKISNHISAIKQQRQTQILYLPAFGDMLEESLVFLDQISNMPGWRVCRDSLKTTKLVSLSTYGAYLFLFKLSVHFSRLQDQFDRKSFLQT